LDDMEKLLAKADLEQAQKNAAPAPPPSAPTTTRTADHPMSGPRPGLGRVRHIGVFVSGGVFVLAALAAVSLRRRRPGRARTAGIVGTSVVAGLALVFLVLAHTALLDPLLRSIAP